MAMNRAGQIRRIVATLAKVSLAACLLFVLLWLFAWLVRPDVYTAPEPYSQEEIEAERIARDDSFDINDPVILHVDVDYDNPHAAWRPKGESPILRQLVDEGHLPPVAERVGPEPVVMRGVDGIGKYGGTWLRLANAPSDVHIVGNRLSGATLVRASPYGHPIVPHLARSIETRDEGREYLITLRRGMRFSDGHPLTVDDIMYWWNHEINDPEVIGSVPGWITSGGKAPTFEKLDDLRLIVRFEKPHGQFLELLVLHSTNILTPEHYLRQYHPRLGDEELCRREMAGYGLPSRLALYNFMKAANNPDHPRMWPWVYRRYQPSSPQVFVRNPYYPVVDEQGNQLPYIDRLQFTIQDGKLITLAAANGLVSMQLRHIRYADITELMSRRQANGYRVLHWYSSSRSTYVINPNLNRRVDPDDPRTAHKAALLSDKRFRQALSLAIDRPTIIRAEYNNQVEASQVQPGPQSPFHNPRLGQAFIDYDPPAARRLLEQLRADGLLGDIDSEGCYRFPDGSRMVFYLDCSPFTGMGMAEFIVADWEAVGVRVIARSRERSLFYADKDAMNFDFNVWSSESDVAALAYPRYYMPSGTESFYAVGWGRWYDLGGFYGNPEADRPGAIAPPRDHPMYKAMEAYDRAISAADPQEQQRHFTTVTDIAAENLWTISLAEAPPQPVVVSNDMRNVPKNALVGWGHLTPANAGLETYYFENPADSPGAIAETRDAILITTPRPGATIAATDEPRSFIGHFIRYTLMAVALLTLVLMAVRHPYIGRRLLLMIPTLLIISVVVFTIIQLPPGDFLTARIMQLQEAGGETQWQQIEDLRNLFHFDEPVAKRYARWMGLYWFSTFDRSDEGLLQGNLGRSMESTQPVGNIVGDRILLTVLISLGTILLTWSIAIPIGIYSAVKQYSPADYALTFIGFIGMCVPAFLMALVLMAMAGVSGLFSAEYAAQPEWDMPKVIDLLKHIWIPIVVLGVGGTASMIRVMRANLLDELRKPYVVTAMAKGVRPMKLLLKYPVRLALNPFVSGIGGLFPQLISGGAIVAMVLALPTVGPLMLAALFSQDMYLAGSMLMVLSLLGVFGTLVSDLLLLKLDPRIRFQGGSSR